MEKLIDNAFKFSESGIPVEITAYVDPYYILFRDLTPVSSRRQAKIAST
jgi:hypothetical protein